MRGALIGHSVEEWKINILKSKNNIEIDFVFYMIYINFRIDRGEAMLFTTHTFAAKYKNRHHFSKEALASLHSAHVVHQGSPLLVQTPLINFVVQFHILCQIAGPLSHHYILAKGLRNIQEIPRQLHGS